MGKHGRFITDGNLISEVQTKRRGVRNLVERCYGRNWTSEKVWEVAEKTRCATIGDHIESGMLHYTRDWERNPSKRKEYLRGFGASIVLKRILMKDRHRRRLYICTFGTFAGRTETLWKCSVNRGAVMGTTMSNYITWGPFTPTSMYPGRKIGHRLVSSALHRMYSLFPSPPFISQMPKTC